MSNPIRKVVGLQGPGNMYIPDNQGADWQFYLHPSDYRIAMAEPAYGENLTRNVTRNSNSYLKVWVSWFALQEDFVAVKGHQPQSWQESFDYMNIHDGPNIASPLSQARIQRLDRMIKAANDDGVPVILTIMHSYPTWSNDGGTTTRGRGPAERIPRTAVSNSPWGHFISYLLCRYKKNTPPGDPVGINDPGPRDANWFGNPYGAYVHGMEICNEMNWAVWPQGDEVICRTVEMMQTAAWTAEAHGWHRTGQYLFGPSVLDQPDPAGKPGARPWEADWAPATDWETFTRQVIQGLGNWQPAVYFGWSVHNYIDVAYWGSGGGGQESRLKRVQNMLWEYNWKNRTDSHVWITETGYAKGNNPDAASKTNQDTLCRLNVNRMRGWNYPYVPIWTNHGVLDCPYNTSGGRGMRAGVFRAGDNKVKAVEQYPLQNSWINDMP